MNSQLPEKALQRNHDEQASPVDGFGRHISYARLSLTDRCDFRCVYCMADDMQFVPRKDILSLEELLTVAESLVAVGIKNIRLTGGEPLIRNNMLWLVEQLNHIAGLEELTLTTNGSQLAEHADALASHGVSRVNISLDSLQTDKFARITRTGKLHKVLEGIQAAKRAGFKSIKLNSVILKNRNDDEVLPLVDYAADNGLDIAFIEEMPLGVIDEHDRELSFCSSDEVRQIIAAHHSLEISQKKTNGPSRYYRLAGSDTHIGFISPHSHNFCGDCNRIRVTAEGRLLLCLGNENSVDLRHHLRSHNADASTLQHIIQRALAHKPEKHHFRLDQEPEIVRFMNATGG